MRVAQPLAAFPQSTTVLAEENDNVLEEFGSVAMMMVEINEIGQTWHLSTIIDCSTPVLDF